MASPLNKRFPRELKNNAGKYLGMFLMMTLAIAFTSGFLLAASSIEAILTSMRDTYNVEDGRFTSDFEIDKQTLDKVAALGCTVYENYSYDLPLSMPNGNTATSRTYINRPQVDLPAYAQGRAPERDDEVAFDRVFMANNDLQVGDTIELGGKQFTISGVVTLPDYQALFENNSNFIFNALTFTVAQVSQSAFDQFNARAAKYTYSFTLDDRGASDADRVALEEDMVEVISDDGVVLNDFIDSAANQGIGYALDDVQGDQTMWTALLIILVVIMGFVFVVLNSATIEAESAVIGTLLASGWRKRELLAHYITLPAIVGFVAALAGVSIGFVVLADPMKNLYYNSYSIPPYVAQLNPRVVFITAVIPYLLLVGITFFGLARKLKCTPLQFLRHETGKRSRRHSLHLPTKLPFVTRFRLRVFLRNLSHFVTLFFGIMFASLLMLFGLCLMPVMQHYADEAKKSVPAQHLYTLKAPLEIEGTSAQRAAYKAALDVANAGDITELATEDGFFSTLLLSATIDEDDHPVNTVDMPRDVKDQAEKFAVAQLETERALFGHNESITVYGIQPKSRYWKDIDVSDGRLWTTRGVLDKTKVALGEEALFVDRFAGKDYQLTMTDATESETAMEVYMDIDKFNEVFDNDADYFNGYASDEELDLDDRYVASDMTPDDMGKIARMQNELVSDLRSMLGIGAKISLVAPKSITRSEGKAVRVIDKRKI